MSTTVFEAPTKRSQFDLLTHFGSQVNLSNVRLEEILRWRSIAADSMPTRSIVSWHPNRSRTEDQSVIRSFVIDALPENVARYRDSHAIIVVDAFRATTTIVTAVAAGRRVYPVSSEEEAALVAATLESPLLAGELGGDQPLGFEMNNSPVRIAGLSDRRPWCSCLRRERARWRMRGTPLPRTRLASGIFRHRGIRRGSS